MSLEMIRTKELRVWEKHISKVNELDVFGKVMNFLIKLFMEAQQKVLQESSN